ncbi:MAG: motility associated factor glycosyltransferase family protein [Chlamydiae bacterium]|nr:motility associated factor glycosyltransferase family protein [Chlamydiota bacterium]
MKSSTLSLDPKVLAHDVICVFESDFLDIYLRLTSWLEERKERSLIFLAEAGTAFQDNFLFLSQIPQVICYSLTKESEEQIYTSLAWKFVFLKFYFLSEKKEDSESEQRQKEIFSKLAHIQSAVHLVASEYTDLGKVVAQNIFENGSFLEESLPLSSLYQSCRNIPAIICGAGPSLENEILLLKEYRHKALVFGGGSALSVLSGFSLQPDCSVSFDPDPPYRRYLQQTAFEAPFFYQGRVSYELSKLVHGKRVIAPASKGYLLEEWLLQALKKADTTFDSGWVVGNFATALATFLGCNPIIVVGMDLSFSDKEMYAAGVAGGEAISDGIPCKNSNGEDCLTKPDWLMAAKWFEEFAEAHPEITFINASSSGIQIEGMEKGSLQDIAARYFSSSYDIQGHFHTALFDHEKEASHSLLDQARNEFQESLRRVESFCEKILQNMFQNYPNLSKDTGNTVLLELDLEQELFFRVVLDPFWNVWKHIFAREESLEEGLTLFIHKILFFKKMVTEFSKIFYRGDEYAGSI